MPDKYSSQYREMVLAQVRAGRSVYDLAESLEVSATTLASYVDALQRRWPDLDVMPVFPALSA